MSSLLGQFLETAAPVTKAVNADLHQAATPAEQQY
jgi:hypothetical protein